MMSYKKEKRVALVIGNSGYDNATPLKNPKNDAKAISNALRNLGFDVVQGLNLSNSGMGEKACLFEEKISGADVALLYYSGHGLQFGNDNYLVPIEARIEMEAHLRFGAVPLGDLLSPMMRLARTSLVFLDACRDNPFSNNLSKNLGAKSLRKGLAEVKLSDGGFIAFATSPGSVAYDGTNADNSPFATALLEHIDTKGLSLSDLMIKVHNDVLASTGERQKPWNSFSLSSQFFFKPEDISRGNQRLSRRRDLSQILLEDVFGVDRRNNPLSYIVRDVENDLVKALTNNTILIINIYGASKQGKTSLLRNAMPDSERIHIKAAHSDDTESLYGYMLGAFEKKIDLSNVRSARIVARKLNEITERKIITIDNFHHLDKKVQKTLAKDVSSFEEYGFQFIILGTWTDSGYLQAFNADLTGTVKEISVEPWNTKDLKRVLDEGAKKLNLTFASNFKNSLTERSVGNIGLLQKIINNYLESEGINEVQKEKLFQVGDIQRLDREAGKLEKELLHNVLTNLRVISKTGDEYVAGRTRSYWILKAFLRSSIDSIKHGIQIDELLKKANLLVKHENIDIESMRRENITSLLRTYWLDRQIEAFSTPIIIYEEITDSLVISDSWARFVIRAKRLELAEQL